MFATVYRARASSSSKLAIPCLTFEGDDTDVRYVNETRQLMERGYYEYLKHGRPFSIRNHADSNRPEVILPLKYLDEVRNAPRNVIDFYSYLEKILLPLFARTVARIIYGPELCENEEWLETIFKYINSIMMAPPTVLAIYLPWFRWLGKYFEKNTKQVYKLRRKAATLVRHILQKHIHQDPSTSHDDDNGIQWLVERYNSSGKRLTPEALVQDLLFITVAAIQTSAAVGTSILLDMMDHTESIEEIRAEIAQVEKENSGWSQHALGQLRVLDSFMKESMRLNTFTQVTIERMVLSSITFSDGFSLPAGTQVSFPNQQLNLDPDVHADARAFDAKRFLRKRQETDPNKFHFASVSEDSITWGALKLLFVHLLTHYEFKHVKEGQKRPRDLHWNLAISPDITLPVLFKRRSG
ncbi:cytochrome P450 [Hypoxylon sp. NC1633]|nr:cytochrome P450 [Hypoxylon sp. NC1633]